MKNFLQIGLIGVLLATTLGGVGCTRKPKNITAIPGSEGRGMATDLAPGGPMTSPPLGPSSTGRGNPSVPPGNPFTQNNNPNPVDLPDRTPGGQNQALPLGNPKEGTVEDRDMFRGNIVYFDFDKAAVKKGPETAKAIAVAEYMKAHPEARLEIEGHCDERGTEGYNLALGERRALSVREIMLNNGVPSEKVTTVSFGEARPADPGHDDNAYSKNRRAEFVLLMPRDSRVR